MSDDDQTIVLFRRWPANAGGDAIALFPLVAERRPGTCLSYQRFGQHGAADLVRVIRATGPADPDEPDVQALKRELEAAPYGYRLAVRKRCPAAALLHKARLGLAERTRPRDS